MVPGTVNSSLRLPVSLLERIKTAANKRDVPYQSLIKSLFHLSGPIFVLTDEMRAGCGLGRTASVTRTMAGAIRAI
jgi:CopG antitoxin of type II toxin-antitoxin system